MPSCSPLGRTPRLLRHHRRLEDKALSLLHSLLFYHPLSLLRHHQLATILLRLTDIARHLRHLPPSLFPRPVACLHQYLLLSLLALPEAFILRHILLLVVTTQQTALLYRRALIRQDLLLPITVSHPRQNSTIHIRTAETSFPVKSTMSS